MRREHGSARTWGMVIVAVTLIVLGLLYTFVQTRIRQNKLAMFQISALIVRIQSYREDQGRLPESLDEVAAHSPDRAVQWLDPWGGVIQYQVTGGTYRLLSLGPDGMLSEDDIQHSGPEAMRH